MSAQAHRLYHLGRANLSRSNLSRINISVGRTLGFPKGSMVVIDRGDNDYGWFKQLTEKEIFFVTRLKSNAKYRVVCRREVLKNKGLSCDQTIEFTGTQTANQCPIQLRRIGYRCPETGKHYVFLINNFKLAELTMLILSSGYSVIVDATFLQKKQGKPSLKSLKNVR